ncbi:hypothetical protein CMI47_11510 [Candidatus Pacearchaeota archaeon]|nr:hypothetical protein [Candidatus Pacearchaeota archaeon]|tara:strand:+ start:517 stop:957 length:441 start_codon:yes stop_codon:yes gene_type:complete
MLPQFKGKKDPVFHKFVVFSQFNDNSEIIPKIAACNNCGVIHNIIDFCRSELYYGTDDTASIITKDDLKHNIPDDITKLLIDHNCDLATWEHVCFIYENNKYDEQIIIAKNRIMGSTQIKIVTINSDGKLIIKSILRKDDVDGKAL